MADSRTQVLREGKVKTAILRFELPREFRKFAFQIQKAELKSIIFDMLLREKGVSQSDSQIVPLTSKCQKRSQRLKCIAHRSGKCKTHGKPAGSDASSERSDKTDEKLRLREKERRRRIFAG